MSQVHMGGPWGRTLHCLFHSAQLFTEIMLIQDLPVCLLNIFSSPKLEPELFPCAFLAGPHAREAEPLCPAHTARSLNSGSGSLESDP